MSVNDLERLVAWGTRVELIEWFAENFDNDDGFWPRNWYTSASTSRLRQLLPWHAGLVPEPLTQQEIEAIRLRIRLQEG